MGEGERRLAVSDDGRFLKSILDNLHDGVYFVNRNREILFWNASAERLTGYKAAEVVGKCCHDNIMRHVNAEGAQLCHGSCPLSETLADGCDRAAEVFFHHKDGHRVPTCVRVCPIRDPDRNIVGAVEAFNDNSDSIAALQKVEELQQLALLDPLTRVANRRYIEGALETHLGEMARYGWGFGVLFVDLDDFKRVNDTYGHSVGDSALRMVARTLRHNARSFDLVGRWGGDEFIVVVSNVNEEQLRRLAQRFGRLV
jgi:PAS domain S-box-containing protein